MINFDFDLVDAESNMLLDCFDLTIEKFDNRIKEIQMDSQYRYGLPDILKVEIEWLNNYINNLIALKEKIVQSSKRK